MLKNILSSMHVRHLRESANPCQSPICDRSRKSGKHWEALGTITGLPKLWAGLPSYSNVASSAALSHSVSAVLLQPAPPLWTCAHKAWKGGRKSWCGILENYLCLLEASRSFMHTLWRTMRTTLFEVDVLMALVLTLSCVFWLLWLWLNYSTST